MLNTKNAFAAVFTLLMAPYACDVDRRTDGVTNDMSTKEALLEDAKLAIKSLLECESRNPEHCRAEEEGLIEVLGSLEGADEADEADPLTGATDDLELREIFDDAVSEISELTTVPDAQLAYWTQFYNRDDPSGTGDWEPIWLEPSACQNPTGVVCLTTSGYPYWYTGEVVHCGLDGVWESVRFSVYEAVAHQTGRRPSNLIANWLSA